MIIAGKTAMMEGPGQLNKTASIAYQQLSTAEKEMLATDQPEKTLTRKKVIKRSDKIFSQVQKMVGYGMHSIHVRAHSAFILIVYTHRNLYSCSYTSPTVSCTAAKH